MLSAHAFDRLLERTNVEDYHTIMEQIKNKTRSVYKSWIDWRYYFETISYVAIFDKKLTTMITVWEWRLEKAYKIKNELQTLRLKDKEMVLNKLLENWNFHKKYESNKSNWNIFIKYKNGDAI